MRISLVGPLPSEDNFGGPESITFNIAKFLDSVGDEVFVFKGFYGDATTLRRLGIEVRNIIDPRIIRNSDVVHVILGLKSNGYLGATLAKTLSRPLVWHFHQPKDTTFKGIRYFKYHIINILSSIDRIFLDYSDAIIAVSDYSRRFLLRMGYKGKITVIPPGIDINFFRPYKEQDILLEKYNIKESNRILFVGNLIPRKGLDDLFLAYRLLRQRGYNCCLIIVGEGPEKRHLQQLMKKLRLQDVYFLGRVPNEDLPYIYSSSDIFVLPSLQEGLGIVLLEAMSCGLPVVASNVGGIRDVIKKEVGLPIPPRDHQALTKALSLLIEEEELRKELSIRAMEYVRSNFDWRIIIKKLRRIYSSLVS